MCRLDLLVICGVSAPALADDLPRAAVEAARKREEQLNTVSVTWKVTAFMPKGGRMDADPVGLPLPRQDITVESTHRLVLDGDRFRVEHNDPGSGKGVYWDGDGVLAFDGDQFYHRAYMNGRDKPAHLLREPATSRVELGGLTVRTVALWCRGTRSEAYGGSERGTRSVREVSLEGKSYLEVHIASPTGRSTSHFLDPREDYVVRRIREESAPFVDVTDVEYRHEPTIGWVPARWTWTRTRNGERLVQRTRADVTELRAGEAVTPETFRLEPLPGETVYDHGSGKLFRVEVDGSLEELGTGGEPRGLAERRAPTERVRPTLAAWPGRLLVRYVVLPALLIAVVALIVLRRRRAHTPIP